MTPSADRIEALDVVRGVAVLGILLMNIVAFAMPAAAYANPHAYGHASLADDLVWAADFVAVDGKMRGLFSFLFGASMLLVADRAEAAGANPYLVHYRRMAWLFLFGLAHLYLVWWGDILQHYALVGALVFAARRWEPHRWVSLAIVLLGVQCAIYVEAAFAMRAVVDAVAAGHPSAADLAAFESFRDGFGRPGAATIAADLAVHRGGYATILAHRWADTSALPIQSLYEVGPETAAYQLLGMAALRTGLLTGDWSRTAYRRWAVAGLGGGALAYAALAAWTWARGFDLVAIGWTSLALSVPLRPVTIVGWASLVLLAMRPGGALTARLAAAGRMAFSNYIACSLACTTIFYGYGSGWYGRLTRVALLPVVLLLWVAMLGWSAPWLARFRYGPLEWLWRSLARGQRQPMLRQARPKVAG